MLLEAARERELRYVQVSTDEVYGSIEDGHVHRGEPARALLAVLGDQGRRRPARAELLPHLRPAASICRGSNNYGPYQYPEKLIPLMILNALHGDPLPVYGDGMQVRNWIHATDFCRAIGHVLEHGAPGEVYNAGGPDEEPVTLGAGAARVVDLATSRPVFEDVADRARRSPPPCIQLRTRILFR